MITRAALYTFIEDLIAGSPADTALCGAISFRNLRGSLDDESKVVRVECFIGEHCHTDEEKRKELQVSATVQCWVTPEIEGDAQTNIDDAIDLSFDMSREIFEAMAGNTNLNGLVCDCLFWQFETGEGNLGTVRRGVTYLDGTINQAS